MNEFSHPRGFGSDNHSTIHPKVFDVLQRMNEGHAPAYGQDRLTSQTRELFCRIFGAEAKTFFVFNGTAANVLCLRAFLKSFEAVLTAQSSHLAIDECSAPEFHGGHKILTLPSQDGKIRPQDIEPWLIRRGDQHAAQPRLVSISQPTELGTVYSLAELRALRQFTRQNGLLLHIDGARLANAAVHLGCDFKAMTSDIGIDALSFGGAKNGLLGAEAVVLFNEEAAHDFRYLQKQEMQLPSKVRFFAAQFWAYLQDDLWRDVAQTSCRLARELEKELKPFREIEITQAVQSNAVFARLPKHWVQPLKEVCFFYVWDEREWVVRLMLSHDNDLEDIARFRLAIERLRTGETPHG